MRVPEDIREAYEKASSAIFDLEKKISDNQDDPARHEVYRVRVALGGVFERMTGRYSNKD